MARQAMTAGERLGLVACALAGATLGQEPHLAIDLGVPVRAVVHTGEPGAVPVELVATVEGARLEGGVAVFAEPRAHLTFGPHAALGVTSEQSFTIDCELRTRQAGFATILMCRQDSSVHWSLVLGREPGRVSAELWTWASEKALSARRVDDGAWHRVQGCFHAASQSMVVLVDGVPGDVVQVTQPFRGSPQPRLRLGENLDPGVHQQLTGELRGVSLRAGLPAEAARVLELTHASRLLGTAAVDDALERWLVRQRRPRPPRAASKEEWNERVKRLRAGVQDALGLWPPPYSGETLAGRPSPLSGRSDASATDFTRFEPKLPLTVVEGGSLKRNGYTLTRLYWPSFEGFHAGGWLYRPEPREGKRAAVLCPHGHWQNGACHPVVQARCITLAREGYVVLAVDSEHVGDDRVSLSPVSVMTWNNLRGLELLRSLPEVDAARIGCTGASGGGQQTYYLTALDSGLAAAVPAVMVCYFDEILKSTGVHCWCNFTCHVLRAADAPEMAAAFAPRPQLFLSVLGDWTRDFPQRGFPEIRAVYELFGATTGSHARTAQWDIGHDYNRDMRNGMYRFFDEWLRGREVSGLEAVEPASLQVEPLGNLETLERAGVPRDKRAIEREFHTRLAAPPLTAEALRGGGAEATLRASRDRLERLFHAEPPAEPGRARQVGQATDGRTPWLVRSEPEIDLPAIRLQPENPRPKLPPAILISGPGKVDLLARRRPWVDALLAEGRDVVLVDLRYGGELDRAPAWRDAYGRMFGRDEGLLAVHDLRRVLDALPAIVGRPIGPALVVAFDRFGAPALFAAALDARIGALVAPHIGAAYRTSRRAPQIARILLHGDLPDAACLVAPRPLVLGGASDPGDFEPARAAYARSHGTIVVSEAEPEPAILRSLPREPREGR